MKCHIKAGKPGHFVKDAEGQTQSQGNPQNVREVARVQENHCCWMLCDFTLVLMMSVPEKEGILNACPAGGTEACIQLPLLPPRLGKQVKKWAWAQPGTVKRYHRVTWPSGSPLYRTAGF